MTRLLLVEDDLTIISGLKYALEMEDYTVDVATTIKAAHEYFEKTNYDLFILDINLPDGNGLDFCQEIRQTSNTPIIFLTASETENNIVIGLEVGADDYITKPFRLRELLMRIKAVLRRYEGNQLKVLKIKDLEINLQNATVHKRDQEIVLTVIEYRLLLILAQNMNEIVSRQELVRSLFEFGSEYVSDNTLSVYLKRLREKIEDDPSNPNYIETIRKKGYRLINR